MKQFAVILDWDGVLADSFKNQFEWFHYWAKHPSNKGNKKVPCTDIEEFKIFYNEQTFKEGGVQNVYDALGLDCDMSDKNHPVWNAYIDFKERNPVKIFPEMKKIVKEAYKLGRLSSNNNVRLRLSINTSNHWKTMETPLKKSGIIDCFDSYVDSQVLNEVDGSNASKHIHKPSKISVAYSLGYLGSEGNNTLFFGDTLNDLQATRDVVVPYVRNKQNLICVGVTWGFETEQRLKEGINTQFGTYHFNHIISEKIGVLNLIENYFK